MSRSFKGAKLCVDIVLLEVITFAFESRIMMAGRSVLPPGWIIFFLRISRSVVAEDITIPIKFGNLSDGDHSKTRVKRKPKKSREQTLLSMTLTPSTTTHFAHL